MQMNYSFSVDFLFVCKCFLHWYARIRFSTISIDSVTNFRLKLFSKKVKRKFSLICEKRKIFGMFSPVTNSKKFAVVAILSPI